MNLKYRFLYQNNVKDKRNLTIEVPNTEVAYATLSKICTKKNLDPKDYVGYLGDNLQYKVK